MTTETRSHREDQTGVPALQSVYGKLPAQDVDRARAFWLKTFGLEPYADHNQHLRYEVGGQQFLVFPSTGAPSGTHDQLGLVVADLESEVARLRSLGITLEEFPPLPGATVRNGVMDMGYMRAAWFKDTEGNLISIAEFRSSSPAHR